MVSIPWDDCVLKSKSLERPSEVSYFRPLVIGKYQKSFCSLFLYVFDFYAKNGEKIILFQIEGDHTVSCRIPSQESSKVEFMRQIRALGTGPCMALIACVAMEVFV